MTKSTTPSSSEAPKLSIYQGKLVPSKCQKAPVFSRVSASEILMMFAAAASGGKFTRPRIGIVLIPVQRAEKTLLDFPTLRSILSEIVDC